MLDILNLLERAILKHYYTSLSVIFICENTLELFEIGIVWLHHNDKLQGIINELLVIAAVIAFFQKHRDTSSYILNKIADLDYNLSSIRFL